MDASALPGGAITGETSVGRVPHDADATGGRIFVGNEFSDTMSVIEGDTEVVQFALEDGSLRELARYPTVSQPNSVAVDTSTGRVFVTGGELQFFDPADTESGCFKGSIRLLIGSRESF